MRQRCSVTEVRTGRCQSPFNRPLASTTAMVPHPCPNFRPPLAAPSPHASRVDAPHGTKIPPDPPEIDVLPAFSPATSTTYQSGVNHGDGTTPC
ncbi:hypothetical protein EJ03DRAFT_140849 [Teratosphaeria nubilosa]|uniref:Uncharacterized protein n=1 Tax=Teratosphaeria nubilosa TaxID=161662 RepID=A0A6G1L5I9_9PEZI|nr:hypothetical protein EJ03DRAFT_140849 [Teratosphaeria nubilosa]